MTRLIIQVLLSLLATIIFTTPTIADTDNSGVTIPWGYTQEKGPVHWGELNPAFMLCQKGKKQSPINISKKMAKTPPTLTFHYELAPMQVVNDGITKLTLGETQTQIADGHGLQLNFPIDKTKEAIMLDDHLYRLVQLHIHEPSEHTLQGQSYPLEIHLVHQGNDGHVAVIGVLVQSGASNPTLQKIIDNLPEQKGVEYTVEGQQVNPANLIPRQRNYYNYPGSLTTPPCTEGVDWIVMTTPITASSAQITTLRHALDGDNARPAQALKGRRIYFSKVR